MQRAPKTTSPDTYHEGILDTVSRIEADPDVCDLARGLRQGLDALKRDLRERDDLAEDLIRQRAVLAVRDAALGRVVRLFRAAVVTEGGGNPRTPLLGVYFPDGVRAVTEAEATVVEPREVERLVARIRERGGPLVAKWPTALERGVSGVRAQADVLATLRERIDGIKVRLQARVESIEQTAVVAHGTLRALFVTDLGRAESYFHTWRPRGPRRRGSVPAEARTDAPTTPAALEAA